ncbi:hypothetical protein PHYSODRAFT_332644 [Phytophthora sojae]|uniref:Uncharacterized protein n=1 Tax=Phytophthora sojae (strain P6497) TaxID=1094619 RepID=G4ZJV8_PHYSP|nr:hypothetical protein PHYSODRAFT_332644 [Phytophthora sojae]EGZ18919.1 hypothetical protein PHYSODRAFT_332644 [Phytophthora sojae]|eukprot:XP_009527977.1 hypothetical protein PHYSODRAFT_332644 [Phytophthora sojae]
MGGSLTVVSPATSGRATSYAGLPNAGDIPATHRGEGTHQGIEASDQSQQAFISQQYRRHQATLAVRHKLLTYHREAARAGLDVRLAEYGLSLSHPRSQDPAGQNSTPYSLDRKKQQVYSDFIRRSGMGLPEFVRLLRGETTSDPRPNKALEIPSHLPSWATYAYHRQWEQVVHRGVVPGWKTEFESQTTAPSNHASMSEALNSTVKNIRNGQDKNQYLVLDIDLLSILSGITCSPFGATEKGGLPLSEDARSVIPQGSVRQ